MKVGARAYARFLELGSNSQAWTRCLKGAKVPEGSEASWL